LSNLTLQTGQTLTSRNAGAPACPNPETVTLNKSDVKDSANHDLHELLAVERSLVGGLKVIQRMIASERRLIKQTAG